VRAQVTDAYGIDVRSPSGARPPPATARGGDRRPGSETTQPAQRLRPGRICPRCRHREEGEGAASRAVSRCPTDGFALVPEGALLTADGDPFLGTTVAGRFVILGRIGAGSMGTVYRARQEVMGRDVAIKILRSDRADGAMAKARFGREARAMSLLSSPHTVTVFDFGEIPDPHADELAPQSSLFLAMELLEGESLGARLKRRGRLPVEEAGRITRQALLSLAEAHDKGIIHRDLKPDNLFLARVLAAPAGEIVKVLDFGIAKLRIEGVEGVVDALETQAGTVFGTPRYMSPEQAQGKDLDARSDLYTLGVLLYQMLVGRAPFVDDDAVVVMARHIKSTAVPPAEAAPDAGIGSALSALVMRALAKDPGDRPRTAQLFLAELDRALADGRDRGREDGTPRGTVVASGEMAAVVPDGLSPHPERLPRMRAALLITTSAAVVLAAGLFALGALRPTRMPAARAELEHFAASRRLVVAMGGAEGPPQTPLINMGAPVSPVPVASPPPTSAPRAASSDGAEPLPDVPPIMTGRKPSVLGKHYRKFDHL
jgi:eukaryotic-like serine/threonine-protein kinase